MDPDGRARLARQFRWQAASCGELGSPLYAALLEHAAQDIEGDGPVAEVLRGHEADEGPTALALRLCGGVHALVLSRRAPELALHYPSVGGTTPQIDGAWVAFRRVVAEHTGELNAGLVSPPQTNEVGRAAPLLGALLGLTRQDDLPVRLVEIGASGGLNLRADHFAVAGERGSYGPRDSPVLLRPGWRGAEPAGPWPRVVERLGSDLAPVDVGTPEGRLRLTSYVWADQIERFERLRGALRIAARVPAPVATARARTAVEGLELAEGTWTVLWHSIMWQYLDSAEQADVSAALDALGLRATANERLAHVAFEPRGDAGRRPNDAGETLVALTTWPGGAERLLGWAPAHGLPVTWWAEPRAVLTGAVSEE